MFLFVSRCVTPSWGYLWLADLAFLVVFWCLSSALFWCLVLFCPTLWFSVGQFCRLSDFGTFATLFCPWPRLSVPAACPFRLWSSPFWSQPLSTPFLSFGLCSAPFWSFDGQQTLRRVSRCRSSSRVFTLATAVFGLLLRFLGLSSPQHVGFYRHNLSTLPRPPNLCVRLSISPSVCPRGPTFIFAQTSFPKPTLIFLTTAIFIFNVLKVGAPVIFYFRSL